MTPMTTLPVEAREEMARDKSHAIDMVRMKVVSVIGRLKHYQKPLTTEMRTQIASVIEEYLAREDDRLRNASDLLTAFDAAMAASTTSDAKLMVMANYGDLALGKLRALAIRNAGQTGGGG